MHTYTQPGSSSDHVNGGEKGKSSARLAGCKSRSCRRGSASDGSRAPPLGGARGAPRAADQPEGPRAAPGEPEPLSPFPISTKNLRSSPRSPGPAAPSPWTPLETELRNRLTEKLVSHKNSPKQPECCVITFGYFLIYFFFKLFFIKAPEPRSLGWRHK